MISTQYLRFFNKVIEYQKILLSCIILTFTTLLHAETKNIQNKSQTDALSLEQSYQLTLKNLETFKINRENILRAEAQYREALSAIYPQVNLQIRDTYQNNQISGVINTQRKIDKTRFQTGFTLRQPIFTGFREKIIAEATEEEIKALKLDDNRSKETLYKDVADIYLQILYLEEDILELERNKKVLNDRINELKEFVELGKSRESEKFQSEADLQRVKTTIAQEITMLNAAKELLSYMVNVPSEAIKLDKRGVRFLKTSLDTYLANAEDRNDVKAAKVRESSATKQLKATKREGWPSVNLDANYNPIDKPNREHSESLSLTMTMPLFDGDRIKSRIEQREHELEANIIRSQQIQREALRDIKVAYTNVIYTEKEIEEHKKAIQVAKQALEEEQKDYQQGVVNNLDVLQAITRYHDARRNLLRAETTLKQNQVNLLVASGYIPSVVEFFRKN